MANRKINRKSLLILGTIALMSSCGTSNVSSSSNNMSEINIAEEPLIEKGEDNSPYELYPTPHEIIYDEDSLLLLKRVNVFVEDGVDQYTESKMYDLLSSKDVIVNKLDTVIENDGLSIYLGIYNSGMQVDSLFDDVDLSYIENKIDAYYLEINSNNITIIGKNSDACFYGLSTLEMIFSQTERTIKCLKIKDYSDSIYRGFIEGYYGIPWTPSERIELMRFGSQFKSNIYIYAPKDDSYHSTNWRGLYSEDDLKVLKEQIEVGRKTKTRFTWAIHPFLSNKITLSNYDQGLRDVTNKFDQLYDAGVRQFFVSADDIDIGINRNDFESDAAFNQEIKRLSSENGTLQKKLLNDLVVWNNQKGDCYDLLFVPSAYCYQSNVLNFDIDSYYSSLMVDLDPSIQFLWTGNEICSSVSNLKSLEFAKITNGRTPLMWLNWPVSDYSPSHLLLGKAEVLDKKYESEPVDFAGIVTNPMQQAEPSKLAIFAICDYTWNTNKFDCDASYKASFKYVEPSAYDDFYELAQHLTNSTLYEGRYFEEAKELKSLINNYNYAILNNDNIPKRIKALIDYLDELQTHISNFLDNASNKNLVEAIKPWTLQVFDNASALDDYLTILNGLETTSEIEIRKLLESAEVKYSRALEYKAPILNPVTFNIDLKPVESGIVVLKPFLNKIKIIATDEAKLALGDPTGIVYDGFDGIYEGSVDNIVDGDDDTYCWFNNYPTSDAYIRIDLEKVQEIRDIRILNGNNTGDDRIKGIVEYSIDAKNYELAGAISNSNVETIIDLRKAPIQARFIRIKNVGTDTWVALSDVSINVLGELQDITYSGFEGINEGMIDNIFDGDENTQCWFSGRPQEGASITIKYSKVQTISTIKVVNGNLSEDDMMNGTIELSLDGVTYQEVGSFSSKETLIDLTDSPIKAQYLRICDQSTPHWVALREVKINVELPVGYKTISYEGLPLVDNSWNSLDNMIDGDLNTYTWFDWHCPKDSYIMLDLKKVETITNVALFQKARGCSISGSGENDCFDDITFYYSIDGKNWVQVGDSNYEQREDILIDLSISPIQARYVKVVSNANENSIGVSIREFAVNYDVE